MNKIQIYKSPSISLFSRLLNSSSIIFPYFLLKGTRGSKRKEIEDRIKMALLIRLKNLTLFNSSSHGYHLIVFPRFNNLIAPSPLPPPKKNASLPYRAERRSKIRYESNFRPSITESSLDGVESFPFLEAAFPRPGKNRGLESRLVDSSIFQLSNGRRNVCRACIQTTTMTVLLWIPILDGVKGTTSPLSHSSSFLFCFSRPRVAHVHRFITFDREIETRPRFDFTNSFCADWPDFINVPSGFIRRTSTCITTTKVRTRNWTNPDRTTITRLKYDSSTIRVTSLLISLHVPLIGPLLGPVQTLDSSIESFYSSRLNVCTFYYLQCGIRRVN